MKNSGPFKIVIADTSVIVRSGIVSVLKRVPDLNIQPVEIVSAEALHNFTRLHTPDLMLVNPLLEEWFNITAFKTKNPSVKCIALVYSVMNPALLKDYDQTISICDDADTIVSKINSQLNRPGENEEKENNGQEPLSQREKEIIVCVVKGMTNKEIADKLFLSIHTVITHRRNIARKLQIHSPAGLTIYAIINKLVELQDIKNMF